MALAYYTSLKGASSHACSAGIVLRSAVKPLRVAADDIAPALDVAAGTLVAVSPFLIHHDARFYAAPDRYCPGRHLRQGHLRPASGERELAGSEVGVAASTCPHRVVRDSAGACAEGLAPRLDPNPVAIAFGAGIFRCPGRAFARCMLRAAVAMFVSSSGAHWTLSGSATKASACTQRERGARHTRNVANVPAWLSPGVVPGCHVFCRGLSSGDAHGLLPEAQPQLLVGVKRPVGELWATCNGVF